MNNSKKVSINPEIYRGYDIRGVADKDLSPEVMKQIAKGFAQMLHSRRINEAVVGYDCRLTGPAYSQAVKEGLREAGINVIDLGMCLTQMVYFAQYYYQANGAVMITASHNPADYNGMKLGMSYSSTLDTEAIQELRQIVEKAQWEKAEAMNDPGAEKPGEETKVDLEEFKQAYFKDILKKVTLKRKFKIVIDASCGTTGLFAPEVLKQAGCEVIEENCEIDGNFPKGTPDPTEEHILKRLGERVVETGADLGVAYDGDGDRLGVVDEKGRYIWADVLVAIFADDILDFLPGAKIVYNVLCSKMVDEVISKKGVPIMHKTGHTFIKDKVNQEKAVFGGELSGHFFFMDNFYGHDDALFATLRLLEYLDRKAQPFSKLIDNFGQYISSPEIKLGCADSKKVELVDKKLVKVLKEKYPEAEATTIDGIRLDFPDGMLIIRYSQNGPYITIKFEAKEQEVYDERKKTIRELLKQYPEVEWEKEKTVNLEGLE